MIENLNLLMLLTVQSAWNKMYLYIKVICFQKGIPTKVVTYLY